MNQIKRFAVFLMLSNDNMGGVKKELTSSYVERGMIYFLKEL